MVLWIAQEERIRRLRRAGVQIRRIARETGISRGTIYRVIRGVPRKYPLRKEPLTENGHQTGERFFCAACGAMVFAPCIACRTRQTMEKLNVSTPNVSGGSQPNRTNGMDARRTTLHLIGKDYERYLQIRKNKENLPTDAIFGSGRRVHYGTD